MVVRSAVVGGGKIAKTHIRGIIENPRSSLVGICDIDPEIANSLATEFDTVPYTNVEDLLEIELDCIHVCTPVQSHHEIAIAAIDRDVAVLIEKPTTVTVDEIEDISRRAERSDVPVTVVHNHLFDPALRQARRLIERGELGPVRGIQTTYTGLTPPDVQNRGDWVFELPGGEFEEGLPHPIYSAIGLGGVPRDRDSISVSTSLTRSYSRRFGYDQAQAQFVTAGNALCSIQMLSGGMPQRWHLVTGEDASVMIDEITQSVYRVTDDHTRTMLGRSKQSIGLIGSQTISALGNLKLVAATQLNGDWSDQIKLNSHYAIFDSFCRSVEEDGPVPVPLEQARWVIEIMERIRASGERPEEDAMVDSAHAQLR